MMPKSTTNDPILVNDSGEPPVGADSPKGKAMMLKVQVQPREIHLPTQ